MFNVQGSEFIFILLIALVVLGPEKLPGAIRKATTLYSELRKLSSGFQNEFKAALDEPLRELKGTADLVRSVGDPMRLAEEAEREAEMEAAADKKAKQARETTAAMEAAGAAHLAAAATAAAEAAAAAEHVDPDIDPGIEASADPIEIETTPGEADVDVSDVDVSEVDVADDDAPDDDGSEDDTVAIPRLASVSDVAERSVDGHDAEVEQTGEKSA